MFQRTSFQGWLLSVKPYSKLASIGKAVFEAGFLTGLEYHRLFFGNAGGWDRTIDIRINSPAFFRTKLHPLDYFYHSFIGI
jgi:hypothetical protein